MAPAAPTPGLLDGNAPVAAPVAAPAPTAEQIKATADAKVKADADAAIVADLAKVPDKYEFAKPKDAPLSADDESEVAAEAKALGLTKGQAQKFYDARLANIKSANEAIMADNQRTRAGWVQELMADKTFGGPQFEVSKLNANKLISSAGEHGKEFARILASEGMDSHPALFRFLAHIGSKAAEGKWLDGGVSAPVRDESFEGIANRLYPSLAGNKKT